MILGRHMVGSRFHFAQELAQILGTEAIDMVSSFARYSERTMGADKAVVVDRLVHDWERKRDVEGADTAAQREIDKSSPWWDVAESEGEEIIVELGPVDIAELLHLLFVQD